MSKDPNTNAPPKGGTQESLEDLVYRPSLAAGNKAVQKASPAVTIPATILSYALFFVVGVELAKHSQAAQKVIKKTVGIDLQEQKEEEAPPPPPPPPPAPAAPMAPPRAVERVDAPPPPPLNPNQDVVPELAPKELPKQDLSMAYAGQGGSGSGVPGAGVAGAGVGGGMAIAGSGMSTKVVDFDFTQIKIKVQPPLMGYPPLAKIAKIQGNVTVEIIIGTDGVPTSAHAVEGPPQLRPAAEAYAMQWRFEPAMLNGVPQNAKFRLTIQFKLK